MIYARIVDGPVEHHCFLTREEFAKELAEIAKRKLILRNETGRLELFGCVLEYSTSE